MAAKNNSDKNNKNDKNSGHSLSTETKHGVISVFLFALSVLTVLSFFNLSGLLGETITSVLYKSIGLGAYFVVVLLLIMAYYFLRSRLVWKLWRVAGVFLFLLGLTGLVHICTEPASWWSEASLGEAGGYFGATGAWLAAKLAGRIGGGVLLAAFLIAGFLILFNISLDRIKVIWLAFFDKFKNAAVTWFEHKPSTPVVNNYSNQAPSGQSVVSRIQEQTIPAINKLFKSKAIAKDEPKDEPVNLPKTKSEPTPVKLPLIAKKIQVPIDLLEERTGKPTAGDIEANKEKIRKTLENFGIQVEMMGVNVGPTVTQYTLAPDQGVRLSHITSLSNDLALALAAHPIRIEAPIPGQALVGVEVPNQAVAMVGIKSVMQSEEFKKRPSNLTFVLGRDVSGKPWVADIERMPHLLIAGTTGSGKSVLINTMLISLLYSNSPDELKLIVVDPKRVELSSYNNIPHLLTPVITEVDKTINALKWATGEMDNRYKILSAAGKRNIQSYNQTALQKMPYIVIVIDELADLMQVAAQEVESAIIRIAQMARAVGIHLVLATQRPSVNVITGLIKANIPARVAFVVNSGVDSRTILDTAGAEKLLGRGDCLFVTSEISKPRRVQAAFVGDAEIEKVTSFLKDQAKPVYNDEVVQKKSGGAAGGFESADDDPLLGEATEMVVKMGKASTSFLQRRMRIGFSRAGRIMDQLEAKGIVGPADGAKPRDVLVKPEDLGNMNRFETEPEEDDLVEEIDEENEDNLAEVSEPKAKVEESDDIEESEEDGSDSEEAEAEELDEEEN